MKNKKLKQAIINYRIGCDLALSEVKDGVYTQEEYEQVINGRLDGVIELISAYTRQQVLEAEVKGIRAAAELIKGQKEYHLLRAYATEIEQLKAEMENLA